MSQNRNTVTTVGAIFRRALRRLKEQRRIERQEEPLVARVGNERGSVLVPVFVLDMLDDEDVDNLLTFRGVK